MYRRVNPDYDPQVDRARPTLTGDAIEFLKIIALTWPAWERDARRKWADDIERRLYGPLEAS